MLDDLLGSHARDEIDQMLDALPRTSRLVQDKIKGVEESMAQLSGAITPYTDLADKLKARDERLFSAINQLKLQNQTLQAKNDGLTRDLTKANEDKEVLEEMVSSLRKQRDEYQGKISVMTNEQSSMDKKCEDATKMIDTLRQSEVALASKCSQLQAGHISNQARIGELENLVESERRRHELIVQERDSESTRRMEDQKAGLEHRYKGDMEKLQQDHVEKVNSIRSSYQKALQEGKSQIDDLDRKGKMYLARILQLEKDQEKKMRDYKAECLRQMNERYRQMYTDLSRDQVVNVVQRTAIPLGSVRRTENVNSLFLAETAVSSASDSGRENVRREPSGNNENAPPAAGNRKRASSRGPPIREDAHYLGGNVLQRRGNPADQRPLPRQPQ